MPDISCHLPDGRCLHFVESRANRYNAPLEGRLAKRHAQCYIKQRRFLGAHSTVPIDHILELDSPIFFDKVKANLTLRQVLLTTKTRSNWLHPLLLLIDQVGTSYDSCIEALYCKEKETEVVSLIRYLPLFIVACFGKDAWQWFTSEHKADLEEYEWHAPSGQVKCQTDDDTSSIPHLYGDDAPCNWETLHDDEVLDPAQEPMVFDLDKNFSLLPCLGSENTDNAGSALTNPCHSTSVLAQRNADRV